MFIHFTNDHNAVTERGETQWTVPGGDNVTYFQTLSLSSNAFTVLTELIEVVVWTMKRELER